MWEDMRHFRSLNCVGIYSIQYIVRKEKRVIVCLACGIDQRDILQMLMHVSHLSSRQMPGSAV